MSAMKNVFTTIILAAVFLLSSPEKTEAYQGQVGANPNPLTFWSAADAPALMPALECALARYRAATCLPLDVSLDAAHWVKLAPASAMGGRAGWTTGTSWAQTQVKLLDTLTSPQLCPVLMHEISHILRQSNSHPAPNGSFAYDGVHVVSAPISHLTAEDLTLICAVRPCGCFNPEP